MKYHLLQGLASLLIFSPLNYSLEKEFTMHCSFMCNLWVCCQEFPALWGYLNLHQNLDLLSSCNCCCTVIFFRSQHCYPRGATTVADRLGLGQLRAHPADGIGSVKEGGSFWYLLTEDTLQNLAMQTQYVPFLLFSISVPF